MFEKYKKNFWRIAIFFPIIFYFGKRSYLAFDEGFYALQARWILDEGNWVIPKWWDQYVLDRTIGIQFLIAKSQEIFGNNVFAAHIPTTIAAIIMLIITYKLHEELVGERNAIISPIILSTTYIWFDFAHLATQDLIFSCLISLAIYAIIKINNSNHDSIYLFIFGFWIGLAFMMKTFLVAIPFVSFIPYIFHRKNFLKKKYFWAGLILGFVPFFIWSITINDYLDKNIMFYLFNKLSSLSIENNFSHPFYYYAWNIPVNFLPWSIFSIVGIVYNLQNKPKNLFILSYFPIIIFILISIFSTKTPYYPLQISSLLSINAYIGLEYITNAKKIRRITSFIVSKIISLFILCVLLTYFILLRNPLNLDVKESICLIFGLSFFSISWSLVKNKSSITQFIIPLILGPYFLTSFLIQSGLFTDRSKDIRESMEYISSMQNLSQEIVKVDKSGINSETQSKIIRISLLTPNLGNGIENLNNLKPDEFAWSTLSSTFKNKEGKYAVIYDNKYLSPWKLVKKLKPN